MFELTYVDRGALHCVVDGNGVELHQGQLMVFGPQQWHMQYTDLDMTARFLTVSFDLESNNDILCFSAEAVWGQGDRVTKIGTTCSI